MTLPLIPTARRHARLRLPAGTGPRQVAIDDRAHHAAIEAAVRGHNGSTELASDVPSQGVGARVTAIANVDTRLVNKAAAEAAAALAAAEPPAPPALRVCVYIRVPVSVRCVGEGVVCLRRGNTLQLCSSAATAGR